MANVLFVIKICCVDRRSYARYKISDGILTRLY